MAHIYDEKVMQKVSNQILNTQVTISQHKLLSLALEIHTKIAEATTHHWIVQTNVQAVLEGFPEITANKKAEWTTKAHMPASFAKVVQQVPEDATIISDPYIGPLQSVPTL